MIDTEPGTGETRGQYITADDVDFVHELMEENKRLKILFGYLTNRKPGP